MFRSMAYLKILCYGIDIKTVSESYPKHNYFVGFDKDNLVYK